MVWLLLAIGLSALASAFVVWLHNRPRSLESGIREFSRGLDALAPRQAQEERRAGRGRLITPPAGSPPDTPARKG